MKQTRTLIAILAVAMMLATFASLTAMAQDSTKAAAQKHVEDSVKAMIQENDVAPKAVEPDSMKKEMTPAGHGEPMQEGTAADSMKMEMTPPANEGAMKKETPAATQPDEAKPKEKMEGESKSMTKPEEKPMQAAEPEDPKAPYKNIKFAEGEKPVVVMETSMGTITIELWPDVAKKHCQSFVYLINKGFYDSLTFHRIVPGFVIQGGDPLGNGTGGPGYNVPAEFSNKPHEDGILSMARSNDPNSAGSQFFICLGRLTKLDNNYTVFGKVTDGLDVVHKIEKVETKGERPTTPVYMTKVYMKDKM